MSGKFNRFTQSLEFNKDAATPKFLQKMQAALSGHAQHSTSDHVDVNEQQRKRDRKSDSGDDDDFHSGDDLPVVVVTQPGDLNAAQYAAAMVPAKRTRELHGSVEIDDKTIASAPQQPPVSKASKAPADALALCATRRSIHSAHRRKPIVTATSKEHAGSSSSASDEESALHGDP
jgi:hypothetical protein